jgi:hypothetical protein
VDALQRWDALREAYNFAFCLSAFTHITTVTLVLSAFIFPSLFSRSTIQALNPTNVFVPPGPDSHEQIKDMVQGVLNFLQYDDYIGSAATLVWAIYINNTVSMSKNWLRRFVGVIGMIIAAGPGATITWLMWEKDKLLMKREETARDVRESKDN